MGNWFSSQPDTLEVKQILNKLLNDMMRRSDLRDLYSLADPDQCSSSPIGVRHEVLNFPGKLKFELLQVLARYTASN